MNNWIKDMQKIIIVLVMCCCFIGQVEGQTVPIFSFTASTQTPAEGENFTVDVNVENFQNLRGFQFLVTFDETVIVPQTSNPPLVSFTNIASELIIIQGSYIPGEGIRTSWNSLTGTPVSLNPATPARTIFSIPFSAIGQGSSIITIDCSSFNCEVQGQNSTISTDLMTSEIVNITVGGTNCNTDCTYQLVLEDAAGDGWDGASLDVSINEEAATNYKMDAADGFSVSYSLCVDDGQTIDITYWNGANENEHSYSLLNGEGNIAIDDTGMPVEYIGSPTAGQSIRTTASCNTSCRFTDSLALVALYNSTGGANWTNIWDLDSVMDTWYGVELNGDGCVSCLDLDGNFNCHITGPSPGNNLTGIIPNELSSLTKLTELYLGGNNLSGSIPPEFGELTELINLYISSNNLSGSIPSELSNLTELTRLLLSDNNLSDNIPSELGDLNKLTLLLLSNNNLVGTIPIELSNLTQLEGLYLSVNNLEGSIPPELGALLNLNNLNLHTNQLTGNIPPELGNLTNLEVLSLSRNNFTGIIPDELGSLTNLRKFYLDNNQLEGCFPTDILNHCTLGFINSLSQYGYNFTNNPLLPWQGDFERFCNGEEQIGASCDDGNANTVNDVIQADCTCRGVNINFNVAINDVTACVGDTQVCVPFIVSEFNQILNTQWTVEFDDTVLDFNQTNANSIQNVPPTIIALSNASFNETAQGAVRFSWSDFTGASVTLPDNTTYFEMCFEVIGDLGETSPIAITGSQSSIEVTGFENGTAAILPVTTETGSVTIDCDNSNSCRQTDSLALVALYNSTNGANWTITWDLNSVMDTWYGVTLNGEGCVTCLDLDGLNDCSNFTSIGNILQGNNLQGNIPLELGNLSSLERLYLSDNELSGNIPVELGNLNNLESLSLGSNELSGSIPLDLGYLTNLTLLNLLNNQLSGNIPLELGNLSSLEELYLSGNELSGNIPVELGNLSSLKTLFLGNDDLSGNIPVELGNLSSLETLYLIYTDLSGNIPVELGNLSSLELLILSDNDLSGNIPVELGNLSSLKTLFLGRNDLSGNIPLELGNLNNLEGLFLEYNELSGNIPLELGNLSNLERLFLGNNKLSGSIPTILGSLNNLTHLFLEDNQFDNCFPTELLNHCGIGYNPFPSNQNGFDGYNFSNNPLLPWQGDFERFCNGEEQIGAPCNDGNPNTENDVIQDDCSCKGSECSISAGQDFTDCGTGEALIQAQNPTDCTGMWSSPDLELVFANADSEATLVMDLKDGENLLIWTADCGACGVLSDSLWISYEREPIATTDTVYAPIDGIDTIMVISNDFLPTTYIIQLLTEPLNGSLIALGLGEWAYTHTNSAAIEDQFVYEICNANCPELCSTAAVNIILIPMNIEEEDIPSVPNVISPNGDGLNDVLIVEELETNPDEYPNNEIVIFNRWGSKVFEAKPYLNNWGGTNMKLKPLPEASYYYILRLDIGEGEYRYGYVTVVR